MSALFVARSRRPRRQSQRRSAAWVVVLRAGATVAACILLASCSTEHVIGAVQVSRCMEYPPIRSVRIMVVSDAPDTATARVHSMECLDAPEGVVLTTPMQVMQGLSMRGYIVDDVSEDANARVKLVGFTEPGCPTDRPEARVLCALSTRPLEEELTEEGNTLFIEFTCPMDMMLGRYVGCLAFGVE